MRVGFRQLPESVLGVELPRKGDWSTSLFIKITGTNLPEWVSTIISRYFWILPEAVRAYSMTSNGIVQKL
jgi:hypothetical protein